MPELSEEDLKNMSPEQIAELQKQNCMFCMMGQGKIPVKTVYEDEICFAILDINPASKGHMLLMPKQHYMILPQVPEQTTRHLAKITKLLSRTAIRIGAQGTNIFIANGAVAGQRAPHLIIHVIPRYEGDTITCFELPEKAIHENDFMKIQTQLSKKFGIKETSQPRPQIIKKKGKELEEIDLNQLEQFIK